LQGKSGKELHFRCSGPGLMGAGRALAPVVSFDCRQWSILIVATESSNCRWTDFGFEGRDYQSMTLAFVPPTLGLALAFVTPPASVPGRRPPRIY
jgi:hypothetical protein